MAKFLWFLVALLTIGIGIAILRKLRNSEELPAFTEEQPLAA